MKLVTKITVGVIALALLTGASTSDSKLTERQRALHALNRLAFGPRPGDVDAVMKDGVDAWIEQQLHPEAIPDRAVEARIGVLPTMKLSNAQIVKTYYEPVLMARKKANAEAKDGEVDKKDIRRELMRDIPPGQRPQVVMNDLLAQRILRAAESDRQLNEVMVDFWMNHFNVFSGKGHRPLSADQLRARRDPAAHLGALRGPADGDGEVAGHALLSRQRALECGAGEPAAMAQRGGVWRRPFRTARHARHDAAPATAEAAAGRSQ